MAQCRIYHKRPCRCGNQSIEAWIGYWRSAFEAAHRTDGMLLRQGARNTPTSVKGEYSTHMRFLEHSGILWCRKLHEAEAPIM